MYNKGKEIRRELDDLAKDNGGVVNINDWLAFARNPATASYTIFDWDDASAANQWRIAQARHYLRIQVEVDQKVHQPVHIWVSVSQDRNPEGGYRRMADVLARPDLRQQLLNDALSDLETFQQKYVSLKELDRVMTEISKVQKKPRKK